MNKRLKKTKLFQSCHNQKSTFYWEVFYRLLHIQAWQHQQSLMTKSGQRKSQEDENSIEKKDISAKIALEFNIQPTAPFTLVINISTPKLQLAIFCDSLFCSKSLSSWLWFDSVWLYLLNVVYDKRQYLTYYIIKNVRSCSKIRKRFMLHINWIISCLKRRHASNVDAWLNLWCNCRYSSYTLH